MMGSMKRSHAWRPAGLLLLLLLVVEIVGCSKPGDSAAPAAMSKEPQVAGGAVAAPQSAPAPQSTPVPQSTPAPTREAAAPDGKTTFDLATFTPPAPWKNTAWLKDDAKADHVSYTSTDSETATYCQIFILRSATSKGDVTADFDSEWQNIVVKSYKVAEPAQVTEVVEENGWKAKGGIVAFAFDKGTSIAMLTTIRGYDRVMSIVAVTSGQDYLPAIQALLNSVKMTKPAAGTSPAPKPAGPEAAQPAALQGYMDYNPFTKSWTWKVRYPPSK